jgi:hypothetical protein
MKNEPETIAAVITAMRDAGGPQERFTAGWIDLSFTHKGLADALHAVFRRKPTAQKLGMWLSEQVGTQSGEFVLYGRHSNSAKAWRYAVRKPGEAEELKAAKEAVKEAEREAFRQRELARRKAREEPARTLVKVVDQAPRWSETDHLLNPHLPSGPFDPVKMNQPPAGFFEPVSRPDVPEPPKPEEPNRVDDLRAKLQASLRPGDDSRPRWLDPFGTVAFNIVLAHRPLPFDVIDTPLKERVRIAGGYWPR